jgi:hypothetical protein
MAQQCTDCGYIYRPEEHGGVSLVDQPEWECLGLDGICGATADKYVFIPEGEEEDEGELTEIELKAASSPVVAKPFDSSVSELERMYREKELILQPDWQRYYVWSVNQASRLIESLFIGLPIPLIYLNEELNGTFTVVDGQQRLSAIIEFVQNKHMHPNKTGDVILSGLEVLKELNGKSFSDLTKQEQRLLRNRHLSTVQLKAITDPDLKLTVFQRLNTGTVALVPQELRNAAFRGPYNDALKRWAQNEVFLKLIGRSDGTPHPRMKDVELVLRFCAWMNRGWTALNTKNLGSFLNREMDLGKSLTAGEMNTMERKFKNAVDLALTTFGYERAFRTYKPGHAGDVNGQWELRQANSALYDVVMFGFTRYPKSHFMPHTDALREALLDLMATDVRFQEAIGQSTSDPKRVNYRFTKWLATIDEIVGDDVQKRVFSRKLKKSLFDRDPTCKLCGQEITDMDDAHVHHVEHYWRGGKTIEANAALTHRFCNLSEGRGK